LPRVYATQAEPYRVCFLAQPSFLLPRRLPQSGDCLVG
jgi:hypothetical protein